MNSNKNSNNNLVKIYILKKKIQEYFNKNPNSNSAIFKSNSTHWKVIKEGKRKYKVFEVSTIKDKFIIEEAGDYFGGTTSVRGAPQGVGAQPRMSTSHSNDDDRMSPYRHRPLGSK